VQNAVEDYHYEDYRVKHSKDYKSLVLQSLRKQTSPQELGSPTIENISHPISRCPIVPNIDGRQRETIRHHCTNLKVETPYHDNDLILTL